MVFGGGGGRPPILEAGGGGNPPGGSRNVVGFPLDNFGCLAIFDLHSVRVTDPDVTPSLGTLDHPPLLMTKEDMSMWFHHSPSSSVGSSDVGLEN